MADKFDPQIIAELKKQNEELEKIQGRSNIGDGDISRPNVDPSMFYFNK